MAKDQQGIIDIIDKMVRDGESEEKIIKTLKDIGVDSEEAKKLLLLGQANTFSLLKSEIRKIVEQEMEELKPTMQKFIQEEAMGSADSMRRELTKAVISDLQEYEKDITGQSQTFQDQIKDNINRVNELNEKVKVKLNELGEAVRQLQVDMDEAKLKGTGSRNNIISGALWVFGILFGLGVAYYITTLLNGPITIESLILITILALVSVTMLFVATIV